MSKDKKQRYLYIDGQAVPVTEEVYRAYWHYTAKEDYFTRQLKTERFLADQDTQTAAFTPSREDSYERLLEQDEQFACESKPVEEQAVSYLWMEELFSTLSEEEQQIIYQRQMLERYARERGYNNTRFYIDDGVSGTTFQRSGFQQMISDIQSGQVRRVIVKDMSRFGRDYLQVGMYTEVLFLENDIHFIAVNDGVDSEKGENDFTPLRNLFNEWYARDTSKKSGQFSGQREPPGNA